MASTTEAIAHELDPTELVDLRLGSQSASTEFVTGMKVGQSNTVRAMMDRFSAVMAPVVVFTALFAPGPVPERRLLRASSGTTVGRHWLEIAWDEGEWRYEPEFITERQVAALNELLALSLVPDLDFEFREHE